MTHRNLTFFARQLLIDEAGIRRRLSVPLLVWEEPPSEQQDDYLLGTMSGVGSPRASSRDPLVFELRKGDNKQNAFALGITLGRTENNDVVVDDNSVSRFHAYFQQTRGSWTLVDADSRNGTWVDGERLIGRTPRPLTMGAKLQFGDVAMTLHSPDAFVDFLKVKMKG